VSFAAKAIVNMATEGLKISLPVQGWKQFLTSRKEMLDAFDRAREKAKGHEVETYHGKVAEAEFRKWLSGFLPKRYGVTAGYIISQGIKSTEKAPHFDVIIYDVLNSPVLWIEEDPDTSASGRSMAIPAEYVLAVLEVKATLTSANIEKAVQHLHDLAPLMKGVDDPAERYKLYLPLQFFCGMVFFELRKEHEYSECALTNALSGIGLRGFIGGVVLRGEGHTQPVSGRLKILRSETPIESTIHRSKQSLLQSAPISGSIRVTDTLHFGTMLLWSEPTFAQFAFDMLALMQGTYEVGRLSSFHGMGTSQWDP
jgi:hypothetical protein